MRILGEKCLFYVLYSFNGLLLLSGLAIGGLSLYECCMSGFTRWFDICFFVFGGIMVLTAGYLYFTRFIAELISLYLSAVSVLGSFHISFSIGIMVNEHQGLLQEESKSFMLPFLVTIGIIIILCFALGYSYRNTLHSVKRNSMKQVDRSISLQSILLS
jgi:hypothetical protein